jgi:hypothetical protein
MTLASHFLKNSSGKLIEEEMLYRNFCLIILAGFLLTAPCGLFSLTDAEPGPNYYFQINGGYAWTGIQDAASSENILLFIRRLVDLSPVRWHVSGPAFFGSFHIEGNTYHHNLALEYMQAANGEYQRHFSNVNRPGDSRWIMRARYRLEHYLLKDFFLSDLDFAFGPQVFILWENTDRLLGGDDSIEFSGKYAAPSFLGTLRYHPEDKLDIKIRLSTGGILGFEDIVHPQSGIRENSYFVNGWRTALDVTILYYLSPRTGVQAGWNKGWRMEGGSFASRFATQSTWYFGIRYRVGGSK